MQYSTLLKIAFSALLALPSLAGAFDIPLDAPDGLYSVPINAQGEGLAEPKLLKALNNETVVDEASVAAEIAKRAIPNPTYGCDNYGINSGDYSWAFSDWWSACNGNWVEPWKLYYIKRGSAVVYMCNYGGWNPCVRDESRTALNLVDDKCGFWNAGWVLIPDWAKGYGRSNSGVGICSWSEVPQRK